MQNISDELFLDENIFRKSKYLKRELRKKKDLNSIKVAILGGSSTNEVKNILEIFLLKKNFNPSFYESEYNDYIRELLDPESEIKKFKPDIIYVHFSVLNLNLYSKNNSETTQLYESETKKLLYLWEILKPFNCPIIQNNFELPIFRPLGNYEFYSKSGKVNLVNKLNKFIAEQAENNDALLINDINYLSAKIGHDNWFDFDLWIKAKYSTSFKAVPALCQSIASIVMAVFGQSKKLVILDLDDTLWGGIVGEGVENIRIGQDGGEGEYYTYFQEYIKTLSQNGIVLAINSKNDIENAKQGISHPHSKLLINDFSTIKSNWERKDENINKILQSLNISQDHTVFIDDNPIEREIVSKAFPNIKIINFNKFDQLNLLDSNNLFEVYLQSKEDKNRNKYYQENNERVSFSNKFQDYDDFLRELKMDAKIETFNKINLNRTVQLINKTNQFNINGIRQTQESVTNFMNSHEYITLQGQLADLYGDNGITAIIIAKINKNSLEIIQFLMSCRVIGRNFEYAMMDVLISEAIKHKLKKIIGIYKKTNKNHLVKNLYKDLGFNLIKWDKINESKWEINVSGYSGKNKLIKVNK